MRLDFSNSQQLSAFLIAALLGGVFCIIYDFLRVMLRNYNSGGLVVFIADVAFFSFFGIATFCFFMLFSKGTIRLYLLLGEALGFILARWLLSPYLRILIIFLQNIFNKLIIIALLPLKVSVKYLCKVFNAVKGFLIKIYFKKPLNQLK